MRNKLPRAEKLKITTFEDQSIMIELGGTDADGPITGYTLTAVPADGALYLDPGHTVPAQFGVTYQSNIFYFVPGAEFSGKTSFAYKVIDNQGTTSANDAHVKIVIGALNDAPVVDLNGPVPGTDTALTFLAGSAPVVIAPNATVTDVDTAKFAGGSLRVSITANGTASDELHIATDGTVLVKANGNVFVGGTKIGALSATDNGAHGADLVVTLTGGATASTVSTLLEHITYANISSSPSYGPRTVTFALADGDGTENGGADTGLATAIITVAPVDDGDATIGIVGVAQEDQVLSASFGNNDPDGAVIAGPTYQWYRDGVAIAGATAETYVLGDADVSGRVTVRATYTDGEGFVETVTSGATSLVGNVNDAPVVADDRFGSYLDLVSVAFGGNGLLVYDNDGAGHFTGNGPSLLSSALSVAVGDLNGDGAADIAVGTPLGQPTKIYMNDGSGHFADSGQALGANSTSWIVLGDVDRDGDLDLVEANEAQPIRVLINDGSGTFGDSGQAIGPGTDPVSALGDLDGDGDLDLIAANRLGPSQVYLNDGHGAFTDSGQTLALGDTHGVGLADVDGDGDLDLVDGHLGGPNGIWHNDGHGHFALAQTFGSGGTYGLTAGDVNGDSAVDIVTADYFLGNSHVYLNDGSGFFVDSGQTLMVAGGPLNSALGDIDEDGDPDLVLAVESGPDRVFLNDGNGAFTDSSQALGGFEGTRNVVLAYLDGTPPIADQPHDLDVLANDSDADGDSLSVIAVDGHSAFGAALSINPGGSIRYDPTAAAALIALDANQFVTDTFSYTVSDGHGGIDAATVSIRIGGVDEPPIDHHLRAADSIVYGSDGAGIIRVAADGSLTDLGVRLSNGGAPGYGVAAADINGDGLQDILVSGDNGAGRLHYNNGDGTFTDSGASFPGQFQGSISAADIDNDGDIDPYFTNVTGPSVLYRNDEGAFSAVFSFDVVGPQPPFRASGQEALFGDLNGDGFVDLYARVGTEPAEGDRIFFNDGTGQFTDSGLVLPSGDGRSDLGDGNNDGFLDIVLGPEGVLLNDGFGQFTTQQPGFGPTGGGFIKLGDIDGNGTLDAVTISPGEGGLQWWSNDGTGVFSLVATLDTDAANDRLRIADFNDDGAADIAYVTSANMLTTLMNDGTGHLSVGGSLLVNNGGWFFGMDTAHLF